MRRERPLLVGWNRSPYARRVAISMHICGIEFDQRAQTAWDYFDDIKQFNPKAVQSNGRGTIIFTGATSAVRGGAEFTAFAAGKAGLRSIAQSTARSLGSRGIHVCHVIVDGAIDMPAIHERFPDLVASLPEGGMLDTDAIAETYHSLHRQDRSAWTLEIDVRPWCESF